MLVDGTNLKVLKRHNRYRLAIQGCKLYLVTLALLVNQHHGSNVPSSKTVLGKVTLQNDIVQILNHGVLRFRG